MTARNQRIIGAGILIVGALVACAMPSPNPPMARANGVDVYALNYHWGQRAFQSLGMPLGRSDLELTEQTRVAIEGPPPDSVTAQAIALSGDDRVDLTPAGSANEFTLRIEQPEEWSYLHVIAEYPGDAYVEWVWTVGTPFR